VVVAVAHDSLLVDHEQLGGQSIALTLPIASEWDRLSLDERRALIRATVDRAAVRPGRGAERITVDLFGE